MTVMRRVMLTFVFTLGMVLGVASSALAMAAGSMPVAIASAVGGMVCLLLLLHVIEAV